MKEREKKNMKGEDDRLPTQGSTYRSVSNAFGAYPLSEDGVLRQQRLFCEGRAAEKRLERSRHQTISTALFVLAYPAGSRMGKCRKLIPSLRRSIYISATQYLDRGWRNAEIQFIFLLHTSLNQLLNRVLLLYNGQNRWGWLFVIMTPECAHTTNLLETRETHSLWVGSKIYFQPCEASRPPTIRNDENWHWFPLLKLQK